VNVAEKVLLEKPGHAEANASADRRILRVWIADDNRELRELLGELLNHQPGIRCNRWFPSADAILTALAEERPPDIILLDINMGGQSGLDAIEPIRKAAPGVKVLMWTMFSNGHYEERAFRAGAAGFLLKSYDAPEIVSLLHEARRNPASPALFPSLPVASTPEKRSAPKVELPPRKPEPKTFSLVGAIRHLVTRSPKRSTGSVA
jgi:DNA-binding NarL/FixJ family response regulator